MARLISLRTRLVRNIILLIVGVGLALLAATIFGNRKTVETLSADVIRRAHGQTESHLDHFFGPVVRYLEIAEQQRESGLLDLDKPEAVNAALVPLLRAYPQVSSLMVADDRGREQMVLRMGSGWRVRRTNVGAWGKTVEWREWTDAQPEAKIRKEEMGYDPRARPWFKGAVATLARTEAGASASERTSWTEPYIFFTTKEPGITAAIARPGTITQVIAFDVLLKDLSRFTTSTDVQPSENGMIAVIEPTSGRVIGLPRTAALGTAEQRASSAGKPLAELNAPVLSAALAAAPADAQKGTPFQFESGGASWWGNVIPYRLAGDRTLRVVVAVPEEDLLGDLATLRWIILCVILLALALAVWRAWKLADNISDPIEALVVGSERIAKGDLELYAPVAARTREVQHLANAQERMRLGLQALMKLERDLQVARQIQQQTFPDILPNLKHFDVVGWSEPADATGGDTYDMIGLSGGWQRASLVATEETADRAVLLLADATGHGIGPALSALQLRAMLRMAMRMGGDLGTIAKHMNQQLCEDLPAAQFLTTWLGMLDPDDGTLRTFSAGQAPLLHYRAATDDFESLAADAPPFGILPTIPIAINDPVHLAPGDLYIVFSDGIYEANNPEGEKFEEERVIEIIRSHKHESPKAILQAVRDGVETFARGRPADDDRTAVIIKRL